MTTVEKRRSNRKSSHKKHNDGGYSDTETDREVSSLTDRAFRSLCIGDEAVYNDSDLSASPCIQTDRQLAIQTDRQLAFSHSVQEREELKRTAHECFSLRVQQYGQDWMYRGTYGAEIHKDQQWGVCGERGSQGRLSATFQHSFMDGPQHDIPLNELSLYSNGATEVTSQQRRSRSRVSSLIRAFNTDGQQDRVMDGTLYNEETSWDKSALMSIERELSEFSYQQNMNAPYFPSAGLFSSQNTNYYSSEVAAISQMNLASSFMRSSHSKHMSSMSTQANCNSNFFIHSEFSPFKAWRDQNRFPFQQGQVSGFLPCSEFPKWYETPMYKELSLQQPQQPPSMFMDPGMGYHRNTFAPAVPMNAQRSTSTSSVMQRPSAVEKRCESELAGHYTYRKRAQSTGANRLPSQRPSTASPSSEMSRQVRDTLSSVKSLQQKIKMMAEHNLETQSQGVFYNNNNLNPYGSNAMMPNMMGGANFYTAPNNMMLGSPYAPPPITQQVPEQHTVSPQPIEHAPVRAESRGATPDIKMSSYKSRAASLLYNLKDNRKRVKSTYDPSKFKGPETQEPPKDFIIDVPEFPDSEPLNPMEQQVNRLDSGLQQYGYQVYNPGMLQNSQQLYPGQNSSEYYRPQIQGEVAHHQGFTGFTPQYYTNNQLANGQNPYQNLSSFTPYNNSVSDNYVNRLGHNTAVEMQRFSAGNQSSDYVSKANGKQQFNEAASGEFIGVDRYNQLKENKYDYNNVYSQDKWGQMNSQAIQKAEITPVKNNQNAYQRANTQGELNSLNYNRETKSKTCLIDNYSAGPHGMVSSDVSNHSMPQYALLNTGNNPGYNIQYQPGTYRDSYAPPMSQEYNKENKMKENYAPHDNHKYYDQEPKKQAIISSYGGNSLHAGESGQGEEPVIKENRMENLEPKEAVHFENSKNHVDAKEQIQTISTEKDEKDRHVVLDQTKKDADKAGLSLIKEMGPEKGKETPQQHKEEKQDMLNEKDKIISVQDGHVLTLEEQIKQLREQTAKAEQHELQEVTDKPRHMIEPEPERHTPEKQVIVEYANSEKLKEEPIKCELAQSNERARIEQVKPEPTHKDTVTTEQVKFGAAHVERELTEKEQHEEMSETKQAVKEENRGNQVKPKLEKNTNDVQVIALKLNKDTVVEPQNERENAEIVDKSEEVGTKVDDTQQSSSKSSPTQQEKEPDKVKQAKTELAKTKAELAIIKEIIKEEQKVQNKNENIDKINGDNNSCPKEQEPLIMKPSLNQADRGADDYELIRHKYVKASIVESKVSPESTAAVEVKTEIQTNLNKKTSSINEPTLSTSETNKTNINLYDDPTGSHYIYSESSKDFKLSSSSKLPDSGDKRTDKNAENVLNEASNEKVEKTEASQKDGTKQLRVERKPKSTDHTISKETNSRGLTHKERAQTKQEILTSKIKAHAEKEISAIKEGFATRDGIKNPAKPLTLNQNMSIRQKPPTQEICKKQEGAINDVKQKQFSPPPPAVTEKTTASRQPATNINNKTSIEKTTISNELSENLPMKSINIDKISSQVQGDGQSSVKGKEILDKKKVQPNTLHEDIPSKQVDLDQAGYIDQAPPSLQLVIGQNETNVQDNSVEIMGMMVTVREPIPLESNRDAEKAVQQEVSVKHGPNTGDVTKLDKLSENRNTKNYNQKQCNHKIAIDSVMENTKKNLTNSITPNILPKQQSSLQNDRPQSEIQAPEHQAVKGVPSVVTVPAKNKVLAETEFLPNKHSIIPEETMGYTNKTPKATQETSAIKDQEKITRSMQPTINANKCSLPAASSNIENSQDNLHIDSIAIRVVPAVTDEVKNGASCESDTRKEVSQNEHISSNNEKESDVQKVLSSVRKQAELLKKSNQQDINNVPDVNTKTCKTEIEKRTCDEQKKQPIEGYFQVEKRDSEPHNNSTDVGEIPDAASKERELPRLESNSDTVSNKSLKEEKRQPKTPESSSENMQDGNMKTSKQGGNVPNDKLNKDEKTGPSHSHHTRRHHTSKERQSTKIVLENENTGKAEPKPKPKVPIPEISAIADYARLKVIVSHDNEGTVPEQPPNKKEGFFPLIQSRHGRRPVFTVDSQEVIDKEKMSQSKSDASEKLNKEPKEFVFPITEKEHRRTGMFKLGDKEKTDDKENTDKGSQNTHKNTPSLIEEELENATPENKSSHIDKETNDDRIKQVLEKSRATLAAEAKIAAQREEEQRAQEREAIATTIREQRRKDAERHAETKVEQINPEAKVHKKQQQMTLPLSSEEHQRRQDEPKERSAQEDKRKDVLTDDKKSSVLEKYQKAVLNKEEQRQAFEKKQQTKVSQNEHRTEQQKNELFEEQQRKTALEKQRNIEEQKQKATLEEEQRKAEMAEQQRKVAQEEQQRKAMLIEEQKKRAILEEQQRKAAIIEEQKKRAAFEEQKRKSALEEEKKRGILEEQQKKAALDEPKRRAALEEQQNKIAQQQRKVEEKRRAAFEEQQRKAEEQKQKAALEEQQRRTALIEEQRRKAAEEAQQKKAALEEQQRKMEEEQQRKAQLIEEQKKKAILEEQRRRAAIIEERKRRAAFEEQQRRNEEQKQRAALEEQQKKAALIEEQRRKAAIVEEQKRKAALEEQKQKMALEEQRQRAALEEKQRKAALEEQQRKAAIIEEQKRRAAFEEQQRKAEEQKQKVALEEQQKKAALIEEQRRKAAEEERLRKAALIEEKKKKAALGEEKQRRSALEEQKRAAEEEQQRKEALVEKQRRARQEEDNKRLAFIKEERIRRQIEEEQEAQLEEEKMRQQLQQQNKADVGENKMHKESHTATGKDTRVVREQALPQRELETRARESTNQKRPSETEEQKTEALQYYSLTSAEAEKTSPSQIRNNTNAHETAEDSVCNRAYAPVSPAPSLPRSAASSPALGTKPFMFKVKDNTIRGSSLTKSIKPRFHKNFGEEFRVGSPMERVQDKSAEQDVIRLNAGTPVYTDAGFNKLVPPKEPSTQGYSTPVPQHRPYSRRSIVLDEEDSRSIISNMSEDVESFATSAGDLADIRTLYDSERPESACSFSSDISRSFGKPPAVPPKSEKALRRAKRLATRRLKKESTKTVTDDDASLTEESNPHAMATPHFSPPVSLAHAPTPASSLSSSHTERSFHTSLNASAPISLPIASPHTTAPVSIPMSPQNTGSLSHSVAPKTISHVPSSPTHHAPKPVTQYQVESGFPQSYPVTQRRVMQDVGSGQYYVVDVPVEVKTKTFFDPETGKYVQLNVRESGRNAPQRQPLQAYPQTHPKLQTQAKPQQPPSSKPSAPYQGDPNYPKVSQSAATSSGSLHQSMEPATVTQDQQSIRASQNHRYEGSEVGYSYSPSEKTPYMDTVKNKDKPHTNAVYSTRGSQEGGSQIDNPTHSRFGPRDIISMSELEDFMEVSDW